MELELSVSLGATRTDVLLTKLAALLAVVSSTVPISPRELELEATSVVELDVSVSLEAILLDVPLAVVSSSVPDPPPVEELVA